MLKQNYKIILIAVVFILLLISGLFLFKKEAKRELRVANSFENCLQLGNPKLESYPAQCIDEAGNLFIEDLNMIKKDKIILDTPKTNSVLKSPVVVAGQARGTWYFEGSFPVELVDLNGNIIAQGVATSQSDWMTNEFVPFLTNLSYSMPASTTSIKANLILKKDNPSGMPENDDSLVIPVELQ